MNIPGGWELVVVVLLQLLVALALVVLAVRALRRR